MTVSKGMRERAEAAESDDQHLNLSFQLAKHVTVIKICFLFTILCSLIYKRGIMYFFF